jgi:hypothetical protein
MIDGDGASLLRRRELIDERSDIHLSKRIAVFRPLSSLRPSPPYAVCKVNYLKLKFEEKMRALM